MSSGGPVCVGALYGAAGGRRAGGGGHHAGGAHRHFAAGAALEKGGRAQTSDHRGAPAGPDPLRERRQADVCGVCAGGLLPAAGVSVSARVAQRVCAHHGHTRRGRARHPGERVDARLSRHDQRADGAVRPAGRGGQSGAGAHAGGRVADAVGGLARRGQRVSPHGGRGGAQVLVAQHADDPDYRSDSDRYSGGDHHPHRHHQALSAAESYVARASFTRTRYQSPSRWALSAKTPASVAMA
eukprot:ctg_289.g178